MIRQKDKLQFSEWLTDALLDELNQLGFDCDISWDSKGIITLYIWKMKPEHKAELDKLKRGLISIGKLIDELDKKGLI